MENDDLDPITYEQRMDRSAAYAPSAIPYTRLSLPPGVSPEAFAVFASTDGQD